MPVAPSPPGVGLYDRYLGVRVRWSDAAVPGHVAVVLTERDLLEQGAYARLESLLGWAFDYGAERVTVQVSVLDEAAVPPLARSFEDVDAGDLAAEEIDAEAVESRLVFPDAPDLVVKTGAERLSDFMIWQSVYSELYFTDVNWRDLRKRDYLRTVREFQNRQRRFGR